MPETAKIIWNGAASAPIVAKPRVALMSVMAVRAFWLSGRHSDTEGSSEI
jgi:hypothetical protein